jgi:hypothetical protein
MLEALLGMKNPHRFSCFERLETRRVMAGNLTATDVDHDLVIVGDSFDNNLHIRRPYASNSFFVFGSGPDSVSNTTVNGQDMSVNGVEFTGITGSIRITMGGGNDFVRIGEPHSIGIPGALVISTDDGNDLVILGHASPLVAGTEIILDLGEGHDVMHGERLVPGTSMIVDGRGGNDTISMERGLTNNDIVFRGGPGFDRLHVSDNIVNGYLLLDGGNEADALSLIGGRVEKDAAMLGGPGGDSIHINFAECNASVVVAAGSDFGYCLIENSLFKKTLYATAEGPVQMKCIHSNINQLNLATGPSGDAASVEGCVLEELFAALGEASDSFSITGSRVNRRGRLDGQGGFDVLTNQANILTGVEILNFEHFI